MSLSCFALGAWQLGGAATFNGRINGWGDVSEADAQALLERCETVGIDFIDTAAAYGNGESERRIGRYCPSSSVAICSKIPPQPGADPADAFGEDYVRNMLASSLHRLQRPALDTLLLHGPDVRRLPDRSLFEALQHEGLITHYGISASTRFAAATMLDEGFGDTVELLYNALDRRAAAVIARAQRIGVRTLLRGALASGYLAATQPALTPHDLRSVAPPEQSAWLIEASQRLSFLDHAPGGRAVSALRFVLRQSATRVLVGMRDPARLHDLQQAATLGPLPDDLAAQIESSVPTPFPGWP